jgi:hypothetical protein
LPGQSWYVSGIFDADADADADGWVTIGGVRGYTGPASGFPGQPVSAMPHSVCTQCMYTTAVQLLCNTAGLDPQ